MLAQRTAATDAITGCRCAAHAGPGCPTRHPPPPSGPAVRAHHRHRPTARPRRVGAPLAPRPTLRGRPRPAGARRRWRATAPHPRARGGRRAEARPRCGERGHVDAGARAAQSHVDAERSPVRDAARQFGDHRPGRDAQAADVHADADAAEVLPHPSRRPVDRAPRARSAPGTRPVVAQVGGCGRGA